MTKFSSDLDNCPECGADWNKGDIFEYFMLRKETGDEHYKDKTVEEIKEVAGHYGWTEENPKCFRRLIGIELPYGHPNRYDGVSYWRCPDCETTWNRFTGEKEEIPNG